MSKQATIASNGDMHTSLITITTTQNSIDLEIPAEIPIEKFMPKLLNLCGLPSLQAAQAHSSNWHLHLPDGTPLNATQSLLEAGVTDGAMLVLEDSTAVAQQPPRRKEQAQRFIPKNVTPTPETGGIGVRWNTQEQS